MSHLKNWYSAGRAAVTGRFGSKSRKILLGLLMMTGAHMSYAATSCTPDPGFSNCQRFDSTGGNQTFAVPAGITSLSIKAWGAGGGGTNSGYYTGQPGGGGGLTTGTLAVSGSQSLTIRVGGGGQMASQTATYGGGGGGGYGSGGVAGGQIGASGGGLSGVFSNSTFTQSSALVIAGGGGASSPGADFGGQGGGGGGGLTGGWDGTAYSGKGGTQLAGGARASTFVSCDTGNPTAGSALQGGVGGGSTSSSGEGGGGGGGGFFGGGGGSCQGGDQNGMGGGGSSYLGGAGITLGNTFAGATASGNGNGGAVGGSSGLYGGISGIGKGGGLSNGGNGQVVLQWGVPLLVTKVFVPASIATGGTSTLTITLKNDSATSPSAGIAFTDAYPLNLFNAATPAASTDCPSGTATATNSTTNGTIALSGAALAAQASCTITVTVTSATINTYTNTIAANTVTGSQGATNLAPGSATLKVLGQPTVKINKTTTNGVGSNNFAFTFTGVGGLSPETLTVSGTTTTSGAVHTGTVATAVTAVESAVPTGWPVNPVSVICLDSNAVASGNGTTSTNLATLSGNTATLPASVMKASAVITCTFTNTAAPVILLKKTAPSTLPAGSAMPYTLTLTNNGLVATGTSVIVKDQLPAGVVAASAAPGTGVSSVTCAPLATAGAMLTCTLNLPAGGIAAGATRSFIVNTTAPAVANGTVITNYASTNVAGSGTPGTAPGAACVSNALISCASADTTITTRPKVQIVKTTASGAGSNAFSFALSGLSQLNDTITVPGVATKSGVATITGTAATAASITETSPAGWPANPVSASCRDAASVTPLLDFGTLMGNVLSIAPSNMVNGANITCTFTNAFSFSVTGRVFTDSGSAAGTANDGVVNGGEAGRPGVNVRLTNCAATTIATATTDGSGNYSLSVPFSTAASAALCVEETNLGSSVSTGASVGSTALPSGAPPIAATGGTYTYTRAGTPDKIAFTWNGTGHNGLNFGDVDPNTFVADGAKTGQANNTVVYAHTFTAQTGGVVNFSVLSSTSTPTLPGWNEKVFADVGCTGTLQAGAAVLYPPAAPTVVVAGQQVCIVVQEFIPATALNGYRNTAVVQASFTFTNANPALVRAYSLTDVTTVNSSALDLKKEVRNVTQGGPFGVNNQAKSGETLEYRITYTNNATTPISTLAINDTTPAYSGFVSALAGSTPSTLTACLKTTPANPLPAAMVACPTAQATGNTGPIDWKFTGSLAPGATGTVLFQVKVN